MNIMPKIDPSGDWETVLAGVTVADTITTIRTIRIWADGGTITYTDSSGKTTTDMPVYGGELLPVYGRTLNITATGTNISLLR